MAVRVQDHAAWLREEVVPRILAACPAERIWLFGSRARGDPRPDSDWDLMVVVPDDALPGAEAILRGAVRDGPQRVETHVMSRSGFQDRLHLRASFPSTIVREGRILYEEVSMSAVDAEMWLRKARRELRVIAPLLELDPPEIAIALYHGQQALEKAAKGLLARHDIPIERTHKLVELGMALRGAEPEVAERLIAIDPLGKLAMDLRYPSGGDDPTPEEAARDLAAVRELVEALATRVGELG